jgi:hypothetical protein
MEEGESRRNGRRTYPWLEDDEVILDCASDLWRLPRACQLEYDVLKYKTKGTRTRRRSER